MSLFLGISMTTSTMTPKASGSAQKRMKQSTLLSFFSRQPQSSPISSKKVNKGIPESSPTSITKTSKAVPETPREKKAANKLLFVGMDDDMDSSGFVTCNESATMIDDSSKTVITGKDEEKQVRENSGKGEFGDEEEEDESTSFSFSGRTRKKMNYIEDSDDETETSQKSPSISAKKRRIQSFRTDEDDEADYVPDKREQSDEEFMMDATNDEDDDDLLQIVEKASQKTSKRTASFGVPQSTKKSSARRSPLSVSHNKPKHTNFNKQNEERYQWLVDLRDIQKRPVSDPEYDPRTLYIPSSAWNKFTPFEKQYWEIKSKMWDSIVFFKKGKFFELYEKDAALANALFDWKIAGGGRANMQLAGIPEMSFDYWASQFIQYGYKVAKVDQRESMLAKEMREGSKGIVKRELQFVLTSGSLTDANMLQSDLATYCLAIREEAGNFYDLDSEIATNRTDKIFGIAFIDTSTGEVEMIEFEDDGECTKLDTIISQINPKELIMEKNNLSSLAHKIVKFNSAPQALFNYIKGKEEFYDYQRTYDELCSTDPKYFDSFEKWPEVLKSHYDKGRKVGFSAFGGLLYYLRWLRLDQSLISMGNINEYNPIRSQNSLVLDGVTLQNLEIFQNSFDGTDKGTLFKLFNKAITPMGKRMMKKWLMHPLLKKDDINQRLDTVDFLLSNDEVRTELESYLSKIPDLERLLSRVHSGNLKVKDFDKVLQGFETIVKLLNDMKAVELKGALSKYVSAIPDSLFPDVNNWSNAFDRKKALHDGVLVPHKGIEPEFDESLDRIANLEEELNSVLRSYRKQFNTSNIQFKDSGKEIYTIEVPVSVTKLIPSNWMQMAANKATKRYYSDEVRTLARSMAEARETHKVLEEELKGRLCKKFDAHYSTSWMPTIHSIANMDCLLALVRTSECLGYPSCRPTLVDECDDKTHTKLNGFLKFKSLRHPCFNLGTTSSKEFIPNDVELGKDVPQLALLTGANAAGKSTVLRMTCIAVIMAQMGCYVPCEMATLTPVDRIMTRLGANDNIMQGKSTFFVELSETKKILDLATNRSLLVLDELGRGGSSSDGFAIAEGVLHHVATHIQSLGFFATHYATLGNSFIGHPQVKPMKMSILVEEQTRNVTFLYKLLEGRSEGSFGMHVASMCGISKQIVDIAQEAADNFEHTAMLSKEKQKALDKERDITAIMPLGLESDFVRMVYGDGLKNTALGTGEGVQTYDQNIKQNVLGSLLSIVKALGD